jgi:CRP-like cAMP-binding protein
MAMPMFMLTDEGNTGNDMFLVSKGKLKVYVNGNWVGRIEEGEYFGEIAMLLKCGRRSATVITHEYCDLFIIKRNSFENLMFDYPKDV